MPFSSHNGFRLLELSFAFLRMVFLGLVLLSLQCMSVSHAEQLSAETIPLYEKIITTPNQSAVLNCTVSSGGSIRSFTWKQGSEILRSANSSAGAIYWLSLVLSGNTSAGLYTCEVVDENGNTDTADVAVHVKGKPQIIRYKSSRSPKASTVLHDVNLECYATGFPKPHLEWLRNGVKVTGRDLKHKYSVEKVENGLGSVLHIDGIKKEDDKAYFTCVASNQFGNATRRIKVFVMNEPLPIYRPTMTALSNEMRVNVGEPNVTLTCIGTYAKHPYFTAFWKFKGVQYDWMNNNNASYFVYNTEILLANSSAGENTPKVRTSLVISNVSANDKGNFTCFLVTTTTGDEPATDYIYLSVEETGESDRRGKSQDLLVGLLAMAAVIVVGIIIAAFTCHFWNKEKVRMKKLAEKYDIDGHLFKNDVFITYSGKDYNWVDENLIPLFEEHGVQYIIHSRDFIPGKAIVDNMADSVYESRKVLVVMSRNYMESGYCKEELQMALKRGLDDQGSPVIVMKIDKIDKKELPKSLRNKTFIDYTSKAEQQTWKERLLDIVRVPLDEVTEQT